MIKIKELNPDIFTELELLIPDLKLFTLEDGANLDTLYIFKFGDRFIPDDLESPKVARYIKTLYAINWDKAFDLFTAGDNLMKDFGTMGTKETVREYGYTDTVSDLESVPAFDVATPELDKQNEKTLKHIDDVNRVTVTEDNRDISKFKDSWEYILINYIENIIFNDVNKLITYKIHD